MTLDQRPQLKPELTVPETEAGPEPKTDRKKLGKGALAGILAGAVTAAGGLAYAFMPKGDSVEAVPQPSDTVATAPTTPGEVTPSTTPSDAETAPNPGGSENFTHNLDLWRPADGGRLSPEQQANMSDAEITEAYRIKSSEVDSDEDLFQQVLYRFSEAGRIGSTAEELNTFRRSDGQLGIDDMESFQKAAGDKSMSAMDGFIYDGYSKMLSTLNDNVSSVFSHGRDYLNLFPNEAKFDDYAVGFKLNGAVERINGNIVTAPIEYVNNYEDSYAKVAAVDSPQWENLQTWRGDYTMTITTKQMGDNVVITEFKIKNR